MTTPIPIDLQTLLQKLDEPAGRYAQLDRYYTGTQPLAFLSPEAKTALGNRLGRMASNIPRLAVTALAERLRITGFTRSRLVDRLDTVATWTRLSCVAHREALLLGDSFVIVWADMLGRPKVTVESARQVAVQTRPRNAPNRGGCEAVGDENDHRGRPVPGGQYHPPAGESDRRHHTGIRHR